MTAHWAVTVFAVVVALFGLILGLGGLWLVTLGGSWYYLLAGSAFFVAAVYLMQDRKLGAWIYFGVLGFTLIWALMEVGFDGWRLVPWLVAPGVLALILAALLPLIGRARVSPGPTST